MDERMFECLRALRDALPENRSTHRAVIKAGNALARPLADLRRNQAEMALARAEFRYGRDSVEYRTRAAELAGVDGLIERVRAETARLRHPAPEPGEKIAAVYGYVCGKGKPIQGARVSLVRKDETVASASSAEDGSFSLQAETDEALGLRVIAKGFPEYRDRQPAHGPAPIAAYRLVVLDEPRTEADCPCPPSGGDEGDGGGGRPGDLPDRPREEQPRPSEDLREREQPRPPGGTGGEERPRPSEEGREPERPREPDRGALDPAVVEELHGLTLHAALVKLREREIAVQQVILIGEDSRTPRVVSVRSVPDRRAVMLEVATESSQAGRMRVLATLAAAEPAAEGTPLQGVAKAQQWLHEAGADSTDAVRELTRLSAERFKAKFGLPSAALAKRTQEALDAALVILEG